MNYPLLFMRHSLKFFCPCCYYTSGLLLYLIWCNNTDINHFNDQFVLDYCYLAIIMQVDLSFLFMRNSLLLIHFLLGLGVAFNIVTVFMSSFKSIYIDKKTMYLISIKQRKGSTI